MTSDWHYLCQFISEHSGKDLALATLTHVEGSSYRKPGARLLIDASGSYAGSLSGGCLEAGIAKIGQQVLNDGLARTETVNTQPHFGCPGILTFVIEKIPAGQLLDTIANKIQQRETFQLTTSSTETQLSTLDKAENFTETVQPRPRLVVVGWTSDQEPLFQMASVLNWECIRVVKDSNIAASLSPVADETIAVCAGEDLLETLPADPQTAILIMSHHMATDFSFLSHAASANYSYIGLLGSKRRREKLLNELGENGLLEEHEWTENLYAPVGLDIGASHPTTIALSILAEIQAKFSHTSALPMNKRTSTCQNIS